MKCVTTNDMTSYVSFNANDFMYATMEKENPKQIAVILKTGGQHDKLEFELNFKTSREAKEVYEDIISQINT